VVLNSQPEGSVSVCTPVEIVPTEFSAITGPLMPHKVVQVELPPEAVVVSMETFVPPLAAVIVTAETAKA
jgi:hypothetical protein